MKTATSDDSVKRKPGKRDKNTIKVLGKKKGCCCGECSNG